MIWFRVVHSNCSVLIENTLAIGERKLLRKIFGPGKENGLCRIRTSQKLMNMRRERDIISEIKKRMMKMVRKYGKNVKKEL
jgi:hypothetical protein